MKKLRKIIITILVVLFLFNIGSNTYKVQAETCKNKFETENDDGTYSPAGNSQFDWKSTISGDQFIVKRETSSVSTASDSIKFEVEKVYPSTTTNNQNIGKTFTLKDTNSGVSFTVDSSRMNGFKDTNGNTYTSNRYIKSLSEAQNYIVIVLKGTFTSCTGTFYVSLKVQESYKYETKKTEDTPGTKTSVPGSSETDTEFDAAIEKARENATETYSGEFDNVKSKAGKARTFQCEKNLRKKASEIKFNFDEDRDNDTDYYFDENTKYLYGTSTTETKLKLEYQYHYYNSSYESAEKESINCKITCEEAVEVKYGPPVASKAGLCFEYKVRVESRVKCKGESVNTPKVPGICVPVPLCIEDGELIFRSGGPNEQFEQCVKSCDGGKYTEACSDKCYKQVYYSKNSTKNKLTSNTNRLLTNNKVKKLSSSVTADTWAAEAINQNYAEWVSGSGLAQQWSQYWGVDNPHDEYVDHGGNEMQGYWIWDGSQITWQGNAFSRWHYLTPFGTAQLGGQKEPGWGFADSGHIYERAINGIPTVSWCTDQCSWQKDCIGTNKYLNVGNQIGDEARNKAIYDKAYEECQGLTKCSTSSAEFTISTNYKNKSGTTTTINFPYTKSGTAKDKLTTAKTTGNLCDTAGTGGNTYTEKNTTLNGNLITNYKQCYGTGTCPTLHYYLSEWSFPGSYINKKTGEISYNPTHDGDEMWRDKDKKFCIPRDAASTNTEWWLWYNNKSLSDSVKNSNEYTTYKDECLTDSQKTAMGSTSYTGSVDYNISAKTSKFGFYGWNIEMQCFYATYDSETSSKKSEENAGICGNVDEKIRTVDTEEIIPNTREKINGETIVGFNWKSGAQLTNSMITESGGGASETSKGDGYLVNPETVRTNIENKKDGIYNGSTYVDYEFDLSRTDLAGIKKYNKTTKGFGTFCGEINGIKTNGYKDSVGEQITITHYQSNLFRTVNTQEKCTSSSFKLSVPTSKMPTSQTLKCNNISKDKTSCNQD